MKFHFISLEKSIADMMATSMNSGLEVGSWECPDYPPPSYAMLQGPKVCILTLKKLIIIILIFK